MTRDSMLSLDSLEAHATEEMAKQYAQLDQDWWNGRNAFSFRFDNLRLMASRLLKAQPAQQHAVRSAIADGLEADQAIAVYAGVPWCVQTCSFCDLAYARNPSVDTKREYARLVHKEVENYQNTGLFAHTVNSAYFGGGTPTVLDTDSLCAYLDGVLKHLKLASSAVVTCEASPATLNPRKLDALRSRANRISLGIQTTDTDLRKREGRILDRERMLEKLGHTLERFDLVNADIMYGMRGQTLAHLHGTLSDLISMEVPSITYYRTELFAGTLSHEQGSTEPWAAIDERTARHQYFFGKAMLEAAGYTENPLGWFVKANAQQQVAPWSNMVRQWGKVVPYFGFGQGAFSTSSRYWMQNDESLEGWAQRVERGDLPVARQVDFDHYGQFMVRFMRHLRAFRGLSAEHLQQEYPGNPEVVLDFFRDAARQGLVQHVDDRIELTRGGESLVHWLIDDFARAAMPRPQLAGTSMPLALVGQ